MLNSVKASAKLILSLVFRGRGKLLLASVPTTTWNVTRFFAEVQIKILLSSFGGRDVGCWYVVPLRVTGQSPSICRIFDRWFPTFLRHPDQISCHDELRRDSRNLSDHSARRDFGCFQRRPYCLLLVLIVPESC